MSSIYTKKCNVEHSWRVFNPNYHNLWYIFTKLDILNNFTELKRNCVVKKYEHYYLDFLRVNFEKLLLQDVSMNNYYKYFDMIFCCKERNINDYDDINAYEFLGETNFIKLLLGPYAGLEAKKVSVSGIYKNMYSLFETKNYGYSPESKNTKECFGFITKVPTNDAIFEKWESFLVNKGVKIYRNCTLTNVNIINNNLNSIIINNNVIEGDEFIMSCSLRDINRIIQKNNFSSTLKNDINKLEKENLQLYFTFNLYFSKKLNIDCDTFTLLEEPWIPVIQRKVYWSDAIINKCKTTINNEIVPILEVWNVGVLDYYKGNNNKIISDCNLQEAIEEGILQIKQNKYIQNIFELNNTSFDECLIDFEAFETFKNKNNKLFDTNPKYSVNTGTIKHTPTTQPESFPKNMYISGYYVDNNYGGSTMESSCITGLNASQMIIDKYNLNYTDILPFKHENEIILSKYNFLYPFQLFDKLLYYYNAPPIVKFINSFYLFIFLVLLILILLIFFCYILFNYFYSSIYKKSKTFRISKKK